MPEYSPALKADLVASTIEELSPGILSVLGRAQVQSRLSQAEGDWPAFMGQLAQNEWYTESIRSEFKRHAEVLQSKLKPA